MSKIDELYYSYLPNMHLFMDAVSAALKEGAHKRYNEREGQYIFNCLHEAHPRLADMIVGTIDDPFYVDERIPGFWKFVRENWVKVG